MMSNQDCCNSNLLVAYVEGDLDAATTDVVDEHLQGCVSCRSELRAHQLFICELDAALTENVNVEMPANFSRVVAARASSDMSGVRSSSEHRKALLFSLGLAVGGTALLGSAASQSTLGAVGKIPATVFTLMEFLWSALYNLAASITVISRVLSRKLVVENGSIGFLFVVLIFAILILSRLISNYHSTGATE